MRMASPAPEISPRHRFEARIDIRIQRGEQHLNLQGWTRDMSESGLRAFVADPLEKGETVVFEIPLAESNNRRKLFARSEPITDLSSLLSAPSSGVIFKPC